MDGSKIRGSGDLIRVTKQLDILPIVYTRKEEDVNMPN